MRFDDSLKTVLSADMATGFGAQSAWRQLVDLMSRSRIPADEPTIARLRLLRQAVPDEVRAASGRALAFATPGAALVGFVAEDGISVAAPVLRTAVLPASDWLGILPRLSPQGRSILRHRRDLPGDVVRALESFGATDFVLGDDSPRPDGPVQAATSPPAPAQDTPRGPTPFVSLGDITRGLPVVAEAMRRADPAPTSPASGFRIADLVARIDAFNRTRIPDPLPSAPASPTTAFRYETDRDGVIRWVDGVARGALVGASLAYAAAQGEVRIDAVASGALRQRARFADARIEVGGTSNAAGSWRMAGDPVFDHTTGRFTGFRGIARRARQDQVAIPPGQGNAGADSMRQLVHELRTPTNAISGFAELIEAELLGPVAPPYREHAATIRRQAASLIAAIDDLDTAARIDGRALESRPAALALQPLLDNVARDLAPLAAERQAELIIGDLATASAHVDDRLAARLVSRLLAALISAAMPGEHLAVSLTTSDPRAITLALTRPATFAGRDEATLLRIDADGAEGEGAPLLGVGFALRLARNLAAELGGALAFLPDRLTLRLPTAVTEEVGQATN